MTNWLRGPRSAKWGALLLAGGAAAFVLQLCRPPEFTSFTGIEFPSEWTVLASECQSAHSDPVLFPEIGRGDLVSCQLDVEGDFDDSQVLRALKLQKYGVEETSSMKARWAVRSVAAETKPWWWWDTQRDEALPDFIATGYRGQTLVLAIRRGKRLHIQAGNFPWDRP